MRLLDAFCGAGGAAVGYHRAGFTEIVGVDIKPQPRYPFRFVQGDALDYLREHGHEFDAIHASPPCQRYSRVTAWVGDRSKHPDLIMDVRCAMADARSIRNGMFMPAVAVIENVQDILRSSLMLCGTMFGLRVQSHRWFEISEPISELLPPCCHNLDDASRDHGAKQPESAFRSAIGCEWMTVHGARQAIPPAYTEFIGRQLLEAIVRRATA